MNLEVDVMEGDEFVAGEKGSVFQVRNDAYRLVLFGWVGSWINMKWVLESPRIDLPTFTRYCEGCGLTVKQVKPEPKVETIKPPEWVVVLSTGEVKWYVSEELANKNNQIAHAFGWNGKPQRIDWGAK